jgi:hypothetical protein
MVGPEEELLNLQMPENSALVTNNVRQVPPDREAYKVSLNITAKKADK